MDIKLYNIVAIVNEGNSDRVMEIARIVELEVEQLFLQMVVLHQMLLSNYMA